MTDLLKMLLGCALYSVPMGLLMAAPPQAPCPPQAPPVRLMTQTHADCCPADAAWATGAPRTEAELRAAGWRFDPAANVWWRYVPDHTPQQTYPPPIYAVPAFSFGGGSC